MTITEMEQICAIACSKFNISFNIKITINSRLSRTLGRVISVKSPMGWKVTGFELSKHLYENGTEETIRETVLHECAHYIAITLTKEDHGHDRYFKNICHAIGTTNDKAQYDAQFKTTEKKVEESAAGGTYKYEVICPTCETIIGGYSRMCKTLQNLDSCYCKKCGSGKLYYIQNW